MKIIVLTLGVSTFLFAAAAASCELHAGQVFGAFPGFHPLSQRHFDKSEAPMITVNRIRTESPKAGETSTLKLQYRIPLVFAGASISASSQDDIVLSNEAGSGISNVTGTYELNYSAKEAGTYIVTVRVDAMHDAQPVTQTQSFKIIVTG